MIILLICIVTFLATLSGGLFALWIKDKLYLILGFSAGAVIGVVFFDLLPEAISLGSSRYSAGVITSVVALGFLVYMILDRLALLHSRTYKNDNGLKGKLGAGSLSVHSFLDGIAIGLAFQISTTIGIAIAIAVVAHDFSDGINTVSVLIKDNRKSSEAFKWLLIDATAPFIGVLSTFLFRLPDTLFGLVLALFAGFFLYIGASDLLPESNHRYPKIWTTFMTILGASVSYVVTKLPGF
jgi:zinc transporter ZupT